MSYIPPLASAGIGSGLNVNDIVAKMMSLEERPLLLLQAKVGSTQTKLSAFGHIKSALSALYDAASSLSNPATWRGRAISSSDTSVATASASGSGTVGDAQFSLQVNALAQGQSLASGSFASGASMGGDGEMILQTGQWLGADFTPAKGEQGDALHIHIAKDDTLTDVAAKITQTGAARGISAVVIKGTDGDRLLVRGSQTGAEHGFALSVQGHGSLAKLAYDPQSIANKTSGMERTVQAADAQFSINGVHVTSSSNTVTDVVPGITLNLLKTSETPITVAGEGDTQAVKDKIKTFQEAFNQLGKLLRELSAYDQKSKTGKPLQGDSTVRHLQSALAGLMQRPGANGVTLAALGLEMKLDSDHRNPSLSVDDTKLKAALADLPRLEKLFTGDDQQEGLITRLRDFAFATNGVDGDIATRTKGLQSIQKNTENAMDAMQLRLEQRQSNMLRQYQALDAKMATMSSLSAFLTAQMGQWNKK